MSTTKSLIEIVHDEGYGDSLLMHINHAFGSKDMRALRVVAANAHLIAAAPELYEVLKEILSCACSHDAGNYREIQVPYGLTEDIVAAIKKATGE